MALERQAWEYLRTRDRGAMRRFLPDDAFADLLGRYALPQERGAGLHAELPARQLRDRADLRGAHDQPDRGDPALPRHLARRGAPV